MSESNSFWSDYSENVKNKEKISNLKSKIKNTTNDSPIKTYKKTIFSQNSNKSLKLVEKLSQKKNKIGRFRNLLTNEELKLVNHSINQTVDIDEHVAFNLANTIVKRRFKYFGKKKDDEDDYEIKKRLLELKKIEEEKKRRELERKERERKEREEKELKEKLKKKEFMTTVQVDIEERKRQNHNYKIIKKITKEVEILDKENILEKYKEEPQKENYILKNFKINPLEKSTKTLIVNKSRPQINTRQIKTPKRNIEHVKIEVNKNTEIKQTKDIPSLKNKIKSINVIKNILPKQEVNYDKKIIMVNKIGENNKNYEINKIFVQKNVTQKDIIVKKNDNYKISDNVRNKYKNKNNNKYI